MEYSYDFLYYLSHVFGWIYFFAWGLSGYGQVIVNFRNESVSGLSFDFEMYNLVGFTGYSVYNIWGYFDKNLGTGEVAIQDIVFSVHAVFITIVTFLQIFYYYDKDDPLQSVSTTCILILTTITWGVLQVIFIERVLGLYDPHVKPGRSYRFNSVIYLGWCKIFITLVKCSPQIYSNYKRKSTKGWSIANTLLDFCGGFFSLLQNFVDTFRFIPDDTDPNNPGSLNLAKYALSLISIVIDLIFILQHYYLYKKSKLEQKIDYLVNDA